MQAFLSAGTLATSPVWLWSSTVAARGMERDGDQMVLPVPNAPAFPGSSREHSTLLLTSAPS